jgi:translocation and assembly module TamB
MLPDGDTERRLAVEVALDDTLTVRGGELLPASVAMTGTLGTAPHSDGHQHLAIAASLRGVAGDAALDSAHAELTIADGLLTLDTLFVTSSVGNAHGAGRLAFGDDSPTLTSELVLSARLGELAPLAPLVGARLLGLDSASFDASATGPSDSLSVVADVAGHGFALDEHRLGAFTAEVRVLSRGERTFSSVTGSVQAERGRFARLEAQLIQAVADWDGTGWTARGTIVFDERRQVTFAGSADPRPEHRRAHLETLVVAADGQPWSLRTPIDVRWGDTLAVTGLELASDSGSITVDGAVHDGDDGHLHARWSRVPIAGFTDLLGYQDLGGMLNGSVELVGRRDSPRMSGDLTATLSARRRPSATVNATFGWTAGQLQLDANLARRSRGTLALTGTAPMALPFAGADAERPTSPDDYDLRLTAVDLGLDVLEPLLDPRAASDIQGTFMADARVTGPRGSPVAEGVFELRHGHVRVPTLGVTFDSLNARARLAGDHVLVEGFHVNSGRGSLEVIGRLDRGQPGNRPFDLRITADRFAAVATSEYQATLSGDLRLHGTASAPTLEGALRVRDAHVNLTTAQATAGVERVELSAADLRTLERRFGYGLGGVRSPLDGLYEALALDLTVEVERNSWLRHRQNPQVVLELNGSVHARKEAEGDLLTDGTIELVPGRSFVEQFGTRFEVRSGEVILDGRPEDLTFAVETRHEAGTRQARREGGTTEPAVVITMDVEGTPDEIRLTLASEPELSDAEIVSYLATGQLPNWTPGAQQETNLAADLALRQVARNVQSSLGETLPLDVVEIRSDGIRGVTLVAGRYTTPELYLGLKQPISFSTDEHTSTSATKTTEFEVEYEAYRWLLMNLQGGSSVLRFFLKTRHVY